VSRQKITAVDFIKKKRRGEKIVMITAYDYPFAKIVDEAGVDGILVGDSLAMVVLGLENTLGIGLKEIIHHLRAVVRAKPRALVVADMPFGSYEISTKEALRSAALLVKHGAEAVKLEGGEEIADVVKKIVKMGIPVMGHIGLNPQRVLALGGYKLMGKKEHQREKILRDALALEDAGVFAIVIEHTVPDLAAEITKKVSVPTICIGSGPHCDGQILVLHDVLGLSDVIPYFAKVYADLKQIARDAVRKFVEEVKSGKFPSLENR